MAGLVVVILAGGKGVRLWPVSREALPKPYVQTSESDQTMLQATLRRAACLGGESTALVVCNADHDFIVNEQAQGPARNGVRLILEPDGRNTAPAICAAALVQLASGNDDPMLVLPADHVIRNEERFFEAVMSARELAEAGRLVTFAVKPTFPATGYGYLRIGKPINELRKQFSIEAFVEKPDVTRATQFLESGGYAWNSGMFMFRPSVLIQSLMELQRDVLDACRDAVAADSGRGTVRLDSVSFARAPSISIDHAVMEKSSNVATVLADFDWSDVGDWQAVWSIAAQDANHNAVLGNAEVVNSSGSLVQSDGPLLVGVGLVDMIVVATKDAVLVAPKQHAQDVKLAVEQLKAKNHPASLTNRKVLRPWGSFEQLHIGPGFQVKELTVLPGAKLSLQRHKFRSEHWVCIAGEGIAVRDQDRIRLSTGESVFIPLGAVHRIENPGHDVLRIVETQIGSYTGEDDIERIEDIYGRV